MTISFIVFFGKSVSFIFFRISFEVFLKEFHTLIQ